MGSSVRFGEQRRSHRVHITIAVVIKGKRGDVPFEEETVTNVVNAAGALVTTGLSLQQGQALSVLNKKTAEELPCKVVFQQPGEGGRTQMAFEFLEPAPKFWRISFPPDNWDNSERKRPGEAQRVAPKPSPVTQTPGRK
jgi:hypothetical protein